MAVYAYSCSHMQTFNPSTDKKCEIDCTKENRAVVYRLWPESFLGLYDMGFRAFERLFSYRPPLLAALQLPPEPEKWRTNERMKKIVLALEQTLVRAVATYCEPIEHEDDTPELFSKHMQELGGLHRIIAPTLLPDNFELMFKLLPEVIADVTSARREEGPLSTVDRENYVNVWNSIAVVMIRHFCLGWERRIIPSNPKYLLLIKKAQQEAERRRSLELQQQPPRGRAATDCHPGRFSGSRRSTSRNCPHRSQTQVDMSPTSSNGSYLERGNSAPIALTDLSLEFSDMCDLSPN